MTAALNLAVALLALLVAFLAARWVLGRVYARLCREEEEAAEIDRRVEEAEEEAINQRKSWIFW